jgi:hypothetical protein
MAIGQYQRDDAATCTEINHPIARFGIGMMGQYDCVDGKSITASMLFNADTIIKKAVGC